jgi:hypothetical protein
MSSSILLTIVAASLSLMLVGGGLYEFLVVDPFWPKRPDLIQPARGGISRKRFWIPAHVTFELVLISALIVGWSLPGLRFWLLAALISHAIMRIWSAFDFIPKALAFERSDPTAITEASARRWSHRSLLRLPLDLITCFAMLQALIAVIRAS